VVLKLKMSQVRDITENDIQEPMADQVTTESDLEICVYVDSFFTIKNIQNF
jgi:hypothetical protein